MVKIVYQDALGKHTVIGSDKLKLQDTVIYLQKNNIPFTIERIPNEPKH